VKQLYSIVLTNNIHVAFFPSNTTHFLQPADNLVFTNFKKNLYSFLQEKLTVTTAKDRISIGQMLLKVIFNKLINNIKVTQEARVAITPPVIVKSFENVGIHPWNADLIVQHAKLNIGINLKEENPVDEKYEEIVTLVTKTIQENLGTESYVDIEVTPATTQV
jgi:hypothetical protein